VIVLGYNTPVHNPPAPEHDRLGNFHNQLSIGPRSSTSHATSGPSTTA
jgi:hypothetical protein